MEESNLDRGVILDTVDVQGPNGASREEATESHQALVELVYWNCALAGGSALIVRCLYCVY